MKLLFDHNLSPKLIPALADVYPGSDHVFNLKLHESPDSELWEYAKENSFCIVTKDVDFSELSLLKGFPPKVIWIRRGNCLTTDIEKRLRDKAEEIKNLDEVIGILTLF